MRKLFLAFLFGFLLNATLVRLFPSASSDIGARGLAIAAILVAVLFLLERKLNPQVRRCPQCQETPLAAGEVICPECAIDDTEETHA